MKKIKSTRHIFYKRCRSLKSLSYIEQRRDGAEVH